MTSQKLNERPPRGLHHWATVDRNEPLKGKPSVDVQVWIPREIGDKGTYAIASYVERELGWGVHKSSCWSHGSGDDDLAIATVVARPREIRAELAKQRKYADYREDPDWQAAYERYSKADGRSATERKQARHEAVEALFEIEVRYEW